MCFHTWTWQLFWLLIPNRPLVDLRVYILFYITPQNQIWGMYTLENLIGHCKELIYSPSLDIRLTLFHRISILKEIPFCTFLSFWKTSFLDPSIWLAESFCEFLNFAAKNNRVICSKIFQNKKSQNNLSTISLIFSQ